MQSLFDTIKGQFNSLNFILLCILLGYFFHRIEKKKVATFVYIFALSVFYIFSTDYLPHYLAFRIESRYQPLTDCSILNSNRPILIHVLGGGYIPDQRLQELAQLNESALGRLAEGVRVYHCTANSTLVCSGYMAKGARKSLAAVTKGAAMSLGVDSMRIALLENPTTTHEEAVELRKVYGRDINLVVVTSAIHMDRAIQLFKEQGFHVTPAPTNYLVRKNSNPYHFKFLPSLNNLRIMDAVIHEFLASIKHAIR